MATPEEMQKLYSDALIRRAAQIEEYEKYVAAEKIWAGNALAFSIGDAVPVSTVEKFGWDKEGKVKLRSEFEGAQSLPGLPSKEAEYSAIKEPEAPVQANPAAQGTSTKKLSTK